MGWLSNLLKPTPPVIQVLKEIKLEEVPVEKDGTLIAIVPAGIVKSMGLKEGDTVPLIVTTDYEIRIKNTRR